MYVLSVHIQEILKSSFYLLECRLALRVRLLQSISSSATGAATQPEPVGAGNAAASPDASGRRSRNSSSQSGAGSRSGSEEQQRTATSVLLQVFQQPPHPADAPLSWIATLLLRPLVKRFTYYFIAKPPLVSSSLASSSIAPADTYSVIMNIFNDHICSVRVFTFISSSLLLLLAGPNVRCCAAYRNNIHVYSVSCIAGRVLLHTSAHLDRGRHEIHRGEHRSHLQSHHPVP